MSESSGEAGYIPEKQKEDESYKVEAVSEYQKMLALPMPDKVSVDTLTAVPPDIRTFLSETIGIQVYDKARIIPFPDLPDEAAAFAHILEGINPVELQEWYTVIRGVITGNGVVDKFKEDRNGRQAEYDKWNKVLERPDILEAYKHKTNNIFQGNRLDALVTGTGVFAEMSLLPVLPAKSELSELIETDAKKIQYLIKGDELKDTDKPDKPVLHKSYDLMSDAEKLAVIRATTNIATASIARVIPNPENKTLKVL